MSKSLLASLTVAAFLSAFAVPAHAVQVLTNGNFENGITGWTSFVTSANGNITDPPSQATGPAVAQIATTRSFDVTGSGASNALFLNAGNVTPGGGQQGGGVSQSFTTAADGVATFSANIAAWTRSNSLSVGLVSVLLDGVTLAFHDFGDLNGSPSGASLLSTLGFTTNLAAGTHTLSLQATRPFSPASGVTAQYFDNASLDVAVAATPLPAALPMFISGVGIVGALLRKRRKAKTAVAA